jgi:hypothetical protein
MIMGDVTYLEGQRLLLTSHHGVLIDDSISLVESSRVAGDLAGVVVGSQRRVVRVAVWLWSCHDHVGLDEAGHQGDHEGGHSRRAAGK